MDLGFAKALLSLKSLEVLLGAAVAFVSGSLTLTIAVPAMAYPSSSEWDMCDIGYTP